MGEKTGKIQWKDDFIALHPELEDFTAQRKEDGSIVFSPIDTDKQITVKDALSAKKYAAGASWVFDQIEYLMHEDLPIRTKGSGCF